MEQNLTAELDLAAIASHASMSVRKLNRQFRLQVGTTPQALLTRMRVDRTRTLLESTYLPMDRIAAEAGFGSVESMRVHFGRNVAIPPHKYRANYLQRTPTTRKPTKTYLLQRLTAESLTSASRLSSRSESGVSVEARPVRPRRFMDLR